MTTLSAFVAAVALILAIPEPTNALLAASGAVLGLRPSLWLIPCRRLRLSGRDRSLEAG